MCVGTYAHVYGGLKLSQVFPLTTDTLVTGARSPILASLARSPSLGTSSLSLKRGRYRWLP